ncbi:protein D7-like [Mantella aurantiaca]
MDVNALIQCPYDKSHKVLAFRFPYHLVKCRENNPAAAKKMATCPFNARHIVPKKELELHMQTCENKCEMAPLPVYSELNHGASASKAKNVSCWQSPPCEENWEEDDEPRRPTFVLREFGNYSPFSSHEATSQACTPSAEANPSQAFANHGKSTVIKDRPQGAYPRGAAAAATASAANHDVPGCSFDKEWPRLEKWTEKRTGKKRRSKAVGTGGK